MTKDALRVREHETIRNHVGFYDFTHQLLEVTGSDSGKFLDTMFVNTIQGADVGMGKYTTMLNEDGNIIDDVIVFRIEENKYWISTLYIDKMIKWFDEHKENMDIEYKDITDNVAMFAVQGPKSKEFLNSILEDNIDDMKYQEIIENKIDDTTIKIARSGFTGELGFEIYVDPSYSEFMEEKLCETGRKFEVDKITSDVILSSLPMEKGYVLMSDLEGTNPLESGFEWSIHWDKDFVGKEALEKVKKEGAKRSLLGFTIDDELEINPNSKITIDGKEVGKVTNSTFGYTVGKTIGYALVDNFLANIGDKVLIDGHEATLVERIFYDSENERVRA